MNKHLKYFLKIWLIPAIAGIAIAVFLRGNFFSFVRISGQSMSPNLVNNQIVLLEKKANVSRGTVIVSKTNNLQKQNTGVQDIALRVVALPGDKVNYKKGQLYVNGKKVNQSYISSQVKTETGMSIDTGWSINSLSLSKNWPKSQRNIKKVQKNSYFVLADNRIDPVDSRQYGLIKKKQIEGVVKVFFWETKTKINNVNHFSRNFFE
ncbi:signal peptidase I [Oenococcus oeni]|uniref:Signal peptidase I n=7 Tax=Oenococcus oeni TaxID=1247 RepID=A0AAQ2UWY5_OENOE|nr:signal peptidase I [Oenococcus oeni]OIL40045.1 signal peptidase I [Oenococcus oeni]OIM26757.1 signal peptidase I [Oenococcus oeni]OLQ41746.1 signal peptidase I [Oenococcus oeni]SYW00581.1 Signal peptidase I [Oenococcus oeni]SYW05115.1 Signal peptidase I [Oenococcus oeni]